VQEAVQFYGPELKAAGVELTVDAPDDLPQVGLDEAQIRQVLINLLKNAREAVGSGGHVRLAVSAANGGVVLRVADDGPGIPKGEREHIFEVFHTTKKHGSGLGLALSQQIVVAHGGSIRCRGGDEGGAVFELWFPAYDAPPDEVAPTAKADGRPAA
jgi:signal transduction histidine kinase